MNAFATRPQLHRLSREKRRQTELLATDPTGVVSLCKSERFEKKIWDPACGAGDVSEELKRNGYSVFSTALESRGYGDAEADFLSDDIAGWPGDIVSHPPYVYALQYVEKALAVVSPGRKVAMSLPLHFLDKKKRPERFKGFPPQTIYVSRGCTWFVWTKGHQGPTHVKWIH